MKLEIVVDTKDVRVLKTTDVKVFVDGELLGNLDKIEFAADREKPFCSLNIKYNK
jgi:hypothetical protein